MQAAGLTDKLGDASVPYTVLAPTDEAFGIIPQDDFDALVANTEALNVVRMLLPMHAASQSELMRIDIGVSVGSDSAKKIHLESTQPR